MIVPVLTIPRFSAPSVVTATPAPGVQVSSASALADAPTVAHPQVGTREAMELLEKVHQTPDYQRAHLVVADAQRQLDQLALQKVDEAAEVGRAMSQYGIFALCLPLMGSMFVLSKSGLTGTPALVGLVVGFIGVPALSMYLVRRLGKSRARDKQAEFDRAKDACQSQVASGTAQLQQAEATALARLWNERLQEVAKNPRQAGKVEQTEATVKLGQIVVPRRAESAPPAHSRG